MKQKIMFDTNSFGCLFDNIDKYEENNDKYEFYITPVQIEEIAQIKDKDLEKRINNFMELAKIRPILVPAIAALDHCRVGLCVLGDSDKSTYELLLNETKSNVNDALIGDAAKRENCTLITDDVKFIRKLKKLNINTLTLKEFNSRL